VVQHATGTVIRMLTGICDSCGDASDGLVGVHRIYLRPSAAEPGGIDSLHAEQAVLADVMTEIEQWCFPCRAHYPHEVIDVEG
jgi:hypothetical protein